jgi:hypothetical protein
MKSIVDKHFFRGPCGKIRKDSYNFKSVKTTIDAPSDGSTNATALPTNEVNFNAARCLELLTNNVFILGPPKAKRKRRRKGCLMHQVSLTYDCILMVLILLSGSVPPRNGGDH